MWVYTLKERNKSEFLGRLENIGFSLLYINVHSVHFCILLYSNEHNVNYCKYCTVLYSIHTVCTHKLHKNFNATGKTHRRPRLLPSEFRTSPTVAKWAGVVNIGNFLPLGEFSPPPLPQPRRSGALGQKADHHLGA